MLNKPPGYTKALIAYITFIGMLIAYFMNRDQRDAFATWHIKNMFGLVLLLLISQVAQGYIDIRLGEALWIVAFVWWAFSLTSALLGKRATIPGISEYFQKWFTFLD
ncbi:MAG: hypothetical protein HKM28_03250 [Flavobacteriaceae bacterium]|nr:hypothetical protein [Flavobacteriaceae bacterium]